MQLGGVTDPAFEAVRTRFAACFEDIEGHDPPELGAALAVVVNGELVVDLWGGWCDFQRTTAWERETLTWLFSCRKALSGLAVHKLVDKGLVDYDDTVATHWPAFGGAGKEAITIRHVLSHQAGLPNLPRVEGALTFATIAAGIAAARPEWEPGTAFGYSGTIDWIVQELVTRLTGEPMAGWFQREIADPIGVEVSLELPQSPGERVAVPFSSDGTEWQAPSWWPDNAYGTARALAGLFGQLALGGGNVVSKQTLSRSLEVQVEGIDCVNGQSRAYRLGWRKSAGPGDVQIGSDGFGAPGGFGSVVWADRERRLGFAFLRNLCVPPQVEYRANDLLGAALEIVAG